MTSYIDRLKDPRWQRRRLEVLQRAQFKCEWCESETKTLHVHHRIYRKGAMPWEYADSELECLCVDCHEIAGRWQDHLKEAVGKLDGGTLEQLVGYAEGLLAIQEVINDFSSVEHKKWPVRSSEHALGLADALTCWNTGRTDREGIADCFCDIRNLDLEDIDGLGEGQPPRPPNERR